ncbi:hypothetical protein CapIbe_017317, partial [Capra ibex]
MYSHPGSLASCTAACTPDQMRDGTSCVLPLPGAPQEHDKYFVELSAPVTKLLPGTQDWRDRCPPETARSPIYARVTCRSSDPSIIPVKPAQDFLLMPALQVPECGTFLHPAILDFKLS